MMGVMAFDVGRGLRRVAALANPGEIVASAPDNPPNLINRRREIPPDRLLNFSVSAESLIRVPSQPNIAFVNRPSLSSSETTRSSLQTRFREFPGGTHSCPPRECRPRSRQTACIVPDTISF